MLNNKIRQSLTFLLFLCLLCVSVVNADESLLKDLQSRFSNIQSTFNSLDEKNIENSNLDSLFNSIAELKGRLESCISNNSDKLSTAESGLKLLGEKTDKEEENIQTTRKELNDKIQLVSGEVKYCNALTIQLDKLKDQVNNLKSASLQQQLNAQGLSLFAAVDNVLLAKNYSLLSDLKNYPFIFKQFSEINQWSIFLLIFSGIIIGALLKKYTKTSVIDKANVLSYTWSASVRGIRKTSPILLSLLLIWFYLFLYDEPSYFLLRILQFALLLFFTFAVLRGLLFPDKSIVELGKIPSKRMYSLSMLFLISTIIAYAFSDEAFKQLSNSVVLYMLWLTALIIAGLAFIVLLWTSVRHQFSGHKSIILYLIPLVTTIASIIVATFGYQNMAILLFFGITKSLITLLLTFWVLRIVTEVFDSIDEGRLPWQKKLRSNMKIEPGTPFPGVIWLRFLSFFMILFIGIAALLFVWGDSQRLSFLIFSLKDGVSIGSVNLDVLDTIYALLILVVAFSILPFVKNQLLNSWLKHSNLSSGAKDATQTLVGYVSVAIAILWALSIIGVNFQNLAIIAGALSVGIGFGLQNIVNNFVSGLIILFERPIRRGDWIVVGATEGYVRNISIRSTTIQTFESADVIVPNSELISGQVTNLMLNNNTGRLRVPIGVAYGSDIPKVMKILENIAHNHMGVITGNPKQAIRVLFLSFGDSSLNFELRCFVKNVDSKFSILSDINLGIDREFRKAKIEIPFPQRVIHIEKE